MSTVGPAGVTSPPEGFQQRLATARVYLHLRWLGNDAKTTADRARARRFAELHSDATSIGLI